MIEAARAVFLVVCVMTCLLPHVHPLQPPSSFPTATQKQDSPRQNAGQHQTTPKRRQDVSRGIPNPASIPTSRKSLPDLLPGSPTPTFPGFSQRSGFPSPNIPFHQVFGAGLDSPSPLDFLNQDNFATNNGRKRAQLPLRASGVGEDKSEDLGRGGLLERRHPFSSLRLSPVPTSQGLSRSRPQEEGPFDRDRRDRLPSLFDSDKARRYSLDAPSTFERPIRKSSLPDLHSPIRLDLAPEELQRVAFASSNRGKLAPSRGLKTIADMERPKLTSLFRSKPPPPSLPRLHTPPSPTPSPSAPPSPSSPRPLMQKPEELESKHRLSQSKNKSSAARKQSPPEDKTTDVEKEQPTPSGTEEPPRAGNLTAAGDNPVNNEAGKPTHSEENTVSTTDDIHVNTEGSKPTHNEESVVLTTDDIHVNSVAKKPKYSEDNTTVSTTEQAENLDKPLPVQSYEQPVPNDGSSLKTKYTDLDNATVKTTRNDIEMLLSNRKNLPSAKEQPGIDDFRPVNEIPQPVEDAEQSETDLSPGNERHQFPSNEERVSNPKSLDVEDVPAIDELRPGTGSGGLGAVSPSGSHHGLGSAAGSVIDHNGIAVSFGELIKPEVKAEDDHEQLFDNTPNISKTIERSSMDEEEPGNNPKENEVPDAYRKDTDIEKNSKLEQTQRIKNSDPDSSSTQTSKTGNKQQDSSAPSSFSFSSTNSLVAPTHVPGVSDFSPDSPSFPNDLQADVEDRHASGQLQDSNQNTEDAQRPEGGTKLTKSRDFPEPEHELPPSSSRDKDDIHSDPNDDLSDSEKSPKEYKEDASEPLQSESVSRGKEDNGPDDEVISNSTVDDSQAAKPDYQSSERPPLSSSGSPESDQVTPSSTISVRNMDVTTHDALDSMASSSNTGNMDKSLPSNGSSSRRSSSSNNNNNNNRSSGKSRSLVPEKEEKVLNKEKQTEGQDWSGVGSGVKYGNEAGHETGQRAVDEAGQRAVDETGQRAVDEAGQRAVDEAGQRAVDEAGHDEERGTDNPSGPFSLQVNTGSPDPHHNAGAENGQAHGDSDHNHPPSEDPSSQDSIPSQEKASLHQPSPETEKDLPQRETSQQGSPRSLQIPSTEEKTEAPTPTSSEVESNNPELLGDSLMPTDKETTAERAPEYSDEYDQHNRGEFTDLNNESQQTIAGSQNHEDFQNEPQQTIAGSQSPDNEPQRSNSVNTRSVSENARSRTPSHIPSSSPFEMMFGKSLQQAYHQSFGSLFSNLHKPPSQSRALFGRGGLSVSAGLFGQGAESKSGRGSEQGSEGTDDEADDSHNRRMLDVSNIVKRRPSLRFFAND